MVAREFLNIPGFSPRVVYLKEQMLVPAWSTCTIKENLTRIFTNPAKF
jgi:hypothetical protein